MDENSVYLLIGVGPDEAHAIATSLLEVSAIRPYTHDLMKSVIDMLGATVDSVMIHAVIDSVFHAKLVLNAGQKQLELDTRPSDGIALALKCDAPIYVSEGVVDQAGVIVDYSTEELVPLVITNDTSLDKETLDNLSIFREFVENLDLDDFGSTDKKS